MMLSNSYNETRAQFEKNRGVADPSEVQRLVDDAVEAARFISGNVVQGVLNPETGNLKVTVEEEQIQRGGKGAKRPKASVRAKRVD